MVEERERTLGGERRQPQRQPRELNRHRVQVHPVHAAFRNRAANRCPLGIAKVSRIALAGADERHLVRRGKIAAGGDEKRAAAHRRIHNPEAEDAVRRRLDDQRTERAADQIVGNGLWRIERAGRLARARPRFKCDGSP